MYMLYIFLWQILKKSTTQMQWKTPTVAYLHRKILDISRPNFLYFHAVFGKIWLNNRLRPLPALGVLGIIILMHSYFTLYVPVFGSHIFSADGSVLLLHSQGTQVNGFSGGE